jgi:general secretion pathway protein D
MDEPITLNFKDAPTHSVLEYLSEAAGLVILEVAKVDGRVTLMSRQDITVNEAVALLDTVLKDKGLAAVRNGRVLKIMTTEQARQDLIPVRSGRTPEDIEPSDRIVTQIIPIRNADAIKLKADLKSLIPASADVTSNASSNTLIVTGSESLIRKIVEIVQAIDVSISDVSSVKVFQLKYANASSAAQLITSIFKEDTSATSGGANRRAFTFPGMPGMPGGPGGMGGNQQTDSTETGRRNSKVLASADDRTNTLVVSAAPEVMKVVEGVVKELDSNPAAAQAVFVYRVKNGNSENLASVLNNTFGTGSGTSQTNSNSANNSRTSSSSGLGSSLGSSRGNSSSNSRSGSSGSSGFGSTNSRTSGGTTAGRTGTTGGLGSTNRNASGTSNTTTDDLYGQVYVVPDADTNSLLVTTASKNFDRVKQIITDLDRPVPQVLIKALLAEVTHDDSLDLGVEFSGMNLRVGGNGFQSGSNFGIANAIDTKNSGFMFTLNEENVTAAVRALANVTKLDVLSRPYILTSDNQLANLWVGQYFPFITNSIISDTGSVTNNINYQQIGINLNVTPHINSQGLVTMDVYTEISSLTDSTVPITDTLNAVVFDNRSAENRVAVRDGQTIVIGGLMQDRITKSVDKTPLLGDIPVLGLLFQHSVSKKTKTELLIFLTPHVAQAPDELEQMSQDELDNTKSLNDAVEKGAFAEQLKGLQVGTSTRPANQDNQVHVIEMRTNNKTSAPADGADNADSPAGAENNGNSPE